MSQVAQGIRNANAPWSLFRVLWEFSGEVDHVHLLLDFHPRNWIAAGMSSLKAATGRILKKEFPADYAKYDWGEKAFWSGPY